MLSLELGLAHVAPLPTLKKLDLLRVGAPASASRGLDTRAAVVLRSCHRCWVSSDHCALLPLNVLRHFAASLRPYLRYYATEHVT